MSRFLRSWWPVPLWMGLMFLASTDVGSPAHTGPRLELFLRWLMPHLSRPAFDRIHLMVRKTAHLTEYGILGLLVLRATRLGRSLRKEDWSWTAARWAILLTALYAVSDEFHQSFVPSRHASPVDVAIDVVGAGVALTAAYFWKRRRGRQRPPNSAAA